VVDKRRSRRSVSEGLAGLDDDQASPAIAGPSPLDTTPSPLDTTPSPLDEPASPQR
jgi:sec-independent protein translocase protein TatC